MDIETGSVPIADDAVPPIERLRELEAVTARRLDALERENERLRTRQRMHWVATAGVLGVAAVTMLLMASRGSADYVAEKVQARQFVLRSPAGTERGLFEMTDDGDVRIALRDDAGRERLRLALLPDGSPGVTLSDTRGRTRAVIGALADGTTNIVIADRAGQTRLVLGQSAQDDVSLLMADAQGVTRAMLGLAPNGIADFSVFRPDASAPDATAEATDSVTSQDERT